LLGGGGGGSGGSEDAFDKGREEGGVFFF